MKRVSDGELLAHAAWLRGLAAVLARNDLDADDVVQETWLAAIRTPPDAHRPPRPWLSQVMRNVARMARRAGQRQRVRDRDSDVAPDESSSAEELLERVEAQRRLADYVTQLDEPYRTAILLRYYEGRTAKDIARELGLPAGTVRWRITEGLVRLRARLDRQFDGDRARTRSWLLVMAAPVPRKADGLGMPDLSLKSMAWITAAAVTVALGVGWRWSSSPTYELGNTRDPRSEPQSNRQMIRRDPIPAKEDPMKPAHHKAAAAFFAVAVPALVASAETGGRQLTRDEHIAHCVERWEKMAACPDEIVGFFSNKVAPERRAAHADKFRKQLREAGTGPVEPRRQSCADSVDRISFVPTESEVAKVRTCLAMGDCQQMVACLKPILDKAPPKAAVRP